jgi:hypothetical protein
MAENMVAVLGDSPEQVVSRALAACRCDEPENHSLFAPELLAQVVPNAGDPSLGTHALILFDPYGTIDTHGEGVTALVKPVEFPVEVN